MPTDARPALPPLVASPRGRGLSLPALGALLVVGVLTVLACFRAPAEGSLQAMALDSAAAAIAPTAAADLTFIPPAPQHHPSLTQAHLTRSRLTHAYFLATPQG